MTGELGKENLTWGWILWYSWLAAFNAQPMSCEEDVKLSSGYVHWGVACMPFPGPLLAIHTLDGSLVKFLPVTCFLPLLPGHPAPSLHL